MAKKIIVLERRELPSDLNFDVLFWADVPSARQTFYANASAVSAYKLASGPEIAAIQSGAVTERVQRYRFPSGTGIVAIQAFLASEFNDFQAHINTYNPWVRYGTNWDGTTWTLGGVS